MNLGNERGVRRQRKVRNGGQAGEQSRVGEQRLGGVVFDAGGREIKMHS